MEWTPEKIKETRKRWGLSQRELGCLLGYRGMRSTSMAHSEQRDKAGKPRRKFRQTDHIQMRQLEKLFQTQTDIKRMARGILKTREGEEGKWEDEGSLTFKFWRGPRVLARIRPVLDPDGSLKWELSYSGENKRYTHLRSAKCAFQGF